MPVSSVLSQDSKNVICFHVEQLQMPKIMFPKKWRHDFFLFFFFNCTAKNRDIPLKLCMRVVYVYLMTCILTFS